MRGMMALKRSEEDRVPSRRFTSGRDPSTPDCQRALIAEAKTSPLACRCCESWLRLVPRRPARPQREGLREDTHPRPGHAADEDRADPGEDLAPEQGWHADLRQAEHRVIAGDGRRNRECRGDCSAQDQWTNDGEGDLANYERQRAGDDAGPGYSPSGRLRVSELVR
jgi:hypothetical protein